MRWSVCSTKPSSSSPSYLPATAALIARLDRVRIISHNFGYGVGDDMDSLLANYVTD
jgi:hypothetical protein